MSTMSACACIGPFGDCPCIRQQKGLPIKITETFIAPDIFDCLSDKDKGTINDLKTKAFAIWFTQKNAARELLKVEPSKYDIGNWRDHNHTQKETE